MSTLHDERLEWTKTLDRAEQANDTAAAEEARRRIGEIDQALDRLTYDPASHPLTFYAFVQEMGCPFVDLRGRYLFANGGQSDGDTRHIYPPDVRAERLKLKIEFATHQFYLDGDTGDPDDEDARPGLEYLAGPLGEDPSSIGDLTLDALEHELRELIGSEEFDRFDQQLSETCPIINDLFPN